MYGFAPRPVEKLSIADAARLLQMQKGYACYSLIKNDAAEGGTIGHAIFCPNCGNEIANMYVNFLPPREPDPGSRLAIMTSIARSAIDAKAAVAKKREPRPPQPVVADKS